MKMIACIGGAIAVAAMVPVAASAAPQTSVTKTVTHNGAGTTTRTTVVRDRPARGGWRWQTKCKTWYNHGRKYKSCKKVRARW